MPFFGDLRVADGRIVTISPASDRKNDGEVFDAAGRVVTVPLVNFHEHCYSRLAKGLAVTGPTDNFLHILENLWWKLDRALDHDMIRASAALTAIESIANGVTYIFDHHASPNCIAGSLSVIADVMREFHLRGVLCCEVTDRNGREEASAGLQENRRFIENEVDEDLRGLIGLHAPFTLSDDTLSAAAGLCHELNIGIHSHISESVEDRQHSLAKYSISPTHRLANHRLISQGSILAHGVYLTSQEQEIILDNRAGIACCPDSNFNNGVGVPYYSKIPRGIPLLAGTDGMHANIARTQKQMFLLSRQQENTFADAFDFLRKVYFDQSEFMRRYFPDYPSLQAGDRADFVIWDYVPPAPFSETNFFGHYIYGILENRVHSVIQAGQFLMRAFELTAQDIAAKRSESARQGARLHKRFAEMERTERQ